MSLGEREKRLALQLPVEVRGEDAAGRFRERTRSVNVSGGGICFESHVALPIGVRVELSIELPPGLRRHFGGKPFYRARAVVWRVERSSGTGPARIGARFLRGEASR